MKKMRVGVILGGKSAEHEISLVSARHVIETLDTSKYDVIVIGIDREGRWHVHDRSDYVEGDKTLTLKAGREEVVLSLAEAGSLLKLDVVIPMLHGPFGEDGAIQGLLKMIHVPFVGADVLGSAIGMDKDVTKRLLREAKIPVAPCVVLHRYDRKDWSFERVCKYFAPPFFVKPAALGSSVATYKVRTKEEFEKAVDEALRYDRKVLVEEAVVGREIVCAVMGNEEVSVSIPGEIEPHHEFYSYEAKYLDENGASYHVPARVSLECAARIQEMSKKVYRSLCCQGMARIDFFVTDSEEIIVNELNSIPGFTPISMFPRLWEASGVPGIELLDRLISLAIERHLDIGETRINCCCRDLDELVGKNRVSNPSVNC